MNIKIMNGNVLDMLKNIPNQFKSGKSAEFAGTNPVNNIPKIMNNMHRKYSGVYSNLTPEESEKYGSPRARNMRKKSYNSKYQESNYGQPLQGFTRDNTIEKAREQSYIDAQLLFPDDVKKQKEYIKNVHDHLGNPNGSNPGDVLFDDTIYDLYTDPNIQDAFIEYLERERPELLMPSILDIPTRSHKFAHFAVMPETLVDPLIKVGCSSEVCIKCGKPKTMEYKREIDMENEKSSLGNQDNGIKRQRSRWVKLGVKPSCKCNADFEAGTVLDPFAGSGTVGVVAKKQGKSAILIEISPEYVEIIKNRLEIADTGTNINANIEVASIKKLEEFELEVKN